MKQIYKVQNFDLRSNAENQRVKKWGKKKKTFSGIEIESQMNDRYLLPQSRGAGLLAVDRGRLLALHFENHHFFFFFLSSFFRERN